MLTRNLRLGCQQPKKRDTMCLLPSTATMKESSHISEKIVVLLIVLASSSLLQICLSMATLIMTLEAEAGSDARMHQVLWKP